MLQLTSGAVPQGDRSPAIARSGAYSSMSGIGFSLGLGLHRADLEHTFVFKERYV